jgi:hypothetical protein
MVQYPFSIFSNNMTQKKIIFINGFSGERMLIFELCLADNLKWISRIDNLLETDFRFLTVHFGFGCPNGPLLQDSLI